MCDHDYEIVFYDDDYGILIRECKKCNDKELQIHEWTDLKQALQLIKSRFPDDFNAR